VEDIIEKVKKDRRFSRSNEKALKINITSIINEIKKQNKTNETPSEQESSEANGKEAKMLGKKRFNITTEGRNNLIFFR